MPNEHIEYKCSKCGTPTPREKLTVKRVQFATIGAGYKTLRNRTVAWLCESCLNDDSAWMQSALAAAPGMKNTKLNKKQDS